MRDELAVSSQWVAERLDDDNLRVVECDVSGAAFAEGHIPGAILWNAYSDLRHGDYTPIDTGEFAELLGRSGIAEDTTVVVYGYADFLALWLLTTIGHNSVKLMTGGRAAWEGAGFDWSTESATPERSTYSLAGEPRSIGRSLAEVQAMIGQPGAAILDVRTDLEFSGERFWPSGATEDVGRAGRIPGSVALFVSDILEEDGELKSADALRELLTDRGVGPEGTIVAYCTIGNRASKAWFAMKYLLDYPDVDVYYGSWSEWGHSADTPVT